MKRNPVKGFRVVEGQGASLAQDASRMGRFWRFLACALLVVAAAVAAPAAAHADVLETDLLAGKTAAERGLDPSASPDITARNAFLVDKNGTVLFARDADAAVKIASLTKIMTAIVAIENAPLDTVVTVDKAAADVGESSAGLKAGDTMALDTALLALMVPSGNDASIAIAKAVGEVMTGSKEGAYQAFVEAMNAKAQEIGCKDTLYTNPHGLDFDKFEDEELHSTASDVALVVAYAMQNETFREVVDTGDTTIEVTGKDGAKRSLTLESTDELIGVYDGICGVKTGTTWEADYCFAGAVNRKSGEFYSIVLGSPTSEERFQDTTVLMDWAYENLEKRKLINVSSFVDSETASIPLVAEVAHNDWVNVTVPATVQDPEVTASIYKVKGPVTQKATFSELTGDVKAGSKVGVLTFKQDGDVVAEVDLVAAADQPEPNFFQKIGVWFSRLVRGITDEPKVARSVCYNSPELLNEQ